MVCDKCGSQLGFIQFNGTTSDNPEHFCYCEACFLARFGRAELVAQVKERMRVAHAPFRQEAVTGHLAQVHQTLSVKFDELSSLDQRFTREAYEFIYAAIFYAQMKDAIHPQDRARHVTARELVEGAVLMPRKKGALTPGRN